MIEYPSGAIKFSDKGVTITSGLLHFKLDAALKIHSPSSCAVKSIEVVRSSICGNGICEIGEPETCKNDCIYQIKLCEMSYDLFNRPVMCNGHGYCHIKTGECDCMPGYEGKNCEQCSPGFFHVENDNRCIFGEAMTNRPTETRFDSTFYSLSNPTA